MRTYELDRLLDSLDAPATVVEDPDPDSRKRSAWRTYRRCLETIEADFAVILQDDTVACAGFGRAARAAATARPGRLISFFHGESIPWDLIRMHDAAIRAEPFFEMQLHKWTHTVALGWPRDHARRFLDWVDGQPRKFRADRITDDPVVGAWCSATEERVLATVPSLIDHPDDTLTIVGSHRGNGSGTRRPACWIGDVPVDKWIELCYS